MSVLVPVCVPVHGFAWCKMKMIQVACEDVLEQRVEEETQFTCAWGALKKDEDQKRTRG